MPLKREREIEHHHHSDIPRRTTPRSRWQSQPATAATQSHPTTDAAVLQRDLASCRIRRRLCNFGTESRPVRSHEVPADQTSRCPPHHTIRTPHTHASSILIPLTPPISGFEFPFCAWHVLCWPWHRACAAPSHLTPTSLIETGRVPSSLRRGSVEFWKTRAQAPGAGGCFSESVTIESSTCTPTIKQALSPKCTGNAVWHVFACGGQRKGEFSRIHPRR